MQKQWYGTFDLLLFLGAVGEIILGKKIPVWITGYHKRIPYGTRENSEFENNLYDCQQNP